MFSQQSVPRWVSIEPTPYTIKVVKKEVSETEMAAIYDNDLFKTYIKPTTPVVQKALDQQLPPPPVPEQVHIPEPVVPTFLEPLPISLKGIIIMGDDAKDRAILANNKTKVESTVKIGDKIEDSQLIRIMRNKAIFIRSNGQEEIFYLREKDAKQDQGAHTLERWENTITKIGDNNYAIDPENFVELVPDLGQFIASLDLITVYRKGKPFGVRVGAMDPASFGHELGLQMGDIITNINGTDVTTVKNRMHIYSTVTSLAMGKKIDVTLQRQHTPIHLSIALQEAGKPTTLSLTQRYAAPRKTTEDIQAEKIRMLEEKHTFAPTLDEIRKRERRTILEQVTRQEESQSARNRAVNLEI